MSESAEPAAEETVQKHEEDIVEEDSRPEEIAVEVVQEESRSEEPAVEVEDTDIAGGAAEKEEEKEEKEEEADVDVTGNEPEVLRAESEQEEQDRSELVDEQQQEQEQEEGNRIEEEEVEPEKTLESSQDTMQLPVISMSQGAIEDEEMPSMITVSSPSRIDDSEANIKQDESKSFVKEIKENNTKASPRKEEEDDSDSVCVIDDDDDEPDRSSFDEEDETSSYEEADSDELDTDDKYARTRGRVERTREEVDDDEEEDEDEDEDEGEEDYEDDSELHYSDGCSDDIAVRHSNGLSKRQKERSASLQDLSRIKEQPVKSRQNVNPFSQKARLERNQVNSEQRPQGKQYAHVESKVKKYIMDMTEQRRMSVERRKQAQEEARQKHQEPTETQLRRNEEVAMACKTIKNYTEKALKEVAEYEENEEMYALQQRVENGDLSIIPRRSVGNGEPIRREEEMDVDPISVEVEYNSDEKSDKVNGAVLNENQNNYVPERKGILRREDYSPKPVLNGEEPSIVCDLRTLTYEEYMKGSVNKDVDEVVINNESIAKDTEDVQKFNNNEANPTSVYRIENVTSTYYSSEKGMSNVNDSVMMVNQSTETYYQENSELMSQVNILRSQLDERNTQFSGLSEAYRKVMSENLSMKMELDNLRKQVMHYEEQQKKALDKKVIAVQTEASAQNLDMPIIDVNSEQQQVDPKLAPSMISTVSSQWSDGTTSASYSMEPPPNLTTALNSDESTNLQAKTPAKNKNAFSRAFVTSSRILQTLSSITHGKTKLNKFNTKRSKASAAKATSESTTPAETEKTQTAEPAQTNSRKRKATDTAEISSAAQPFKIPHMSTPEPPIINIEEASDKDPEENPEENSDEEDEIPELDDDVKVFVYPENEAGKEHSFLIQAKEITNNPKPGVRECGPYLLGNVEVYMTEMNGTINIWGKELSQGSTNQNAEDLDTSTRSKDLKGNFRWQSTPRIFKNQGSSPSNNKSKSRISPRLTPHQSHKHSCNMTNTLVECANCSSHSHRVSWPSCNRSAHETQHTCCHPTIRVEESHCGCARKEERRNCCNAQKYVDVRRFSMPSLYQDNCCNNHHNHCRSPAHEESCRHQTFVRRHSFNGEEDDDSNDEENGQCASKSHHSLNENSPHSCSNAKLVPPCSSTSRRSSTGGCSEHSTGQNESDPLIFQKPTSEPSEVRKRRLSGKKVRGLLMDLLKGCGDCRTPINKANNMSIYGPSTSAQLRMDECSPTQSSCPLRASEKCSSCRTRNDKTAEIEAQLEFFRAEMDKLRNRSDTLREMLDALRSQDIIN